MCWPGWFLDPGGWSKAATVGLYFIFPGICTLSLLGIALRDTVTIGSMTGVLKDVRSVSCDLAYHAKNDKAVRKVFSLIDWLVKKPLASTCPHLSAGVTVTPRYPVSVCVCARDLNSGIRAVLQAFCTLNISPEQSKDFLTSCWCLFMLKEPVMVLSNLDHSDTAAHTRI
ncbi:hypothetical protein STEG23_011580 [Scotinomys teguina]